MKVWVIQDCPYYNGVAGIATTYELAVRIAKSYGRDESDIKEYETDVVPYQPAGMEWYGVEINHEGTFLRAWPMFASEAEPVDRTWQEIVQLDWYAPSLGFLAYQRGERRTVSTLRSVTFKHWAESEERAIGIAHEHFAWLVEQGMLPLKYNGEAHERLREFISRGGDVQT